MGLLKLCGISLCVYALQGCKTIPTNNSIAAIIPVHTTESFAELKSVIGKALNDVPITISNTAFNNSNKLILERKKAMGPDGRMIQTRVDQQPIVFELFIIESSCYLKRSQNSERFPLALAKCIKM